MDLLVDALALLAPQAPTGWRCVIAGSGPLEDELRARVSACGLAHVVTFLGFVQDVAPVLQASDIYVSASEKEGLPLSLIEGMACGLPCVVTDIEGHREIITDGVNGLLVPPASEGALARAIQHLLACREERLKMGLNGRDMAERQFDVEAAMERLISVVLA